MSDVLGRATTEAILVSLNNWLDATSLPESCWARRESPSGTESGVGPGLWRFASAQVSESSRLPLQMRSLGAGESPFADADTEAWSSDVHAIIGKGRRFRGRIETMGSDTFAHIHHSRLSTIATDVGQSDATGSLVLGGLARTQPRDQGAFALRSNEDVYPVVERFIQFAQAEDFEAGTESAFAAQMSRLVQLIGVSAVEPLAYLCEHELASPVIWREAVIAMAELRHAPTYNYRRWFIERSLQSRHSIVRDAGLIGVAMWRDATLIQALGRAFDAESVPALKIRMGQTLSRISRQ